jgi:hypothetical protein
LKAIALSDKSATLKLPAPLASLAVLCVEFCHPGSVAGAAMPLQKLLFFNIGSVVFIRTLNHNEDII